MSVSYPAGPVDLLYSQTLIFPLPLVTTVTLTPLCPPSVGRSLVN